MDSDHDPEDKCAWLQNPNYSWLYSGLAFFPSEQVPDVVWGIHIIAIVYQLERLRQIVRRDIPFMCMYLLSIKSHKLKPL